MRTLIKNTMRIAVLLLLFLAPAMAQAGNEASGLPQVNYMNVFILALLGVVVLALVFLLITLKVLVDQTSPNAERTPVLKDIMAKLADSVPVEKEESILTDHNYDGIRELDNNLPLWWKYMFYATIVFAGIYIYYYHYSESGQLQIQEYEYELVEAQKDIDAYMAKSANSINEENVKMSDVKGIENGKTLFLQNCAACHGRAGEGGVGPNLTDQYWIHGGGIKNIFKTIKYGVPENGMKSWKSDFSPKNIQEIASYIRSLEGSNPPNGKAAQGEKYIEKKELAGN